MSRWTLVYEGADPGRTGLREALCTLGNGVFATRGADPEARADGEHYPGTYLAGCFDRAVSEVAGREVENEDMVNAPNWLPLTFRAGDGAWFTGPGEGVRLELDMRRGVLTRAFEAGPPGLRTRVVQHRLVSMDDPHLAALETTFVPVDWSGTLVVRSELDGDVANTGVARYRGLASRHLVPGDACADGEDGEDTVWLRCTTARSRIGIALAARTRVTSGPPAAYSPVPAANADTARDTRAAGDTGEPGDTGVSSGTRDVRGAGDTGEARDAQDARDIRGVSGPQDAGDTGGAGGAGGTRDARGGRERHTPGTRIGVDLALEVTAGEPVTVEKTVALCTSRDHAAADPLTAARACLARAAGFDALLERHTTAWHRLWRACSVDVGDEEDQRILNLHLFHLLQTLSPHTADLDAGVPARGLHGEAYRGHVFWDELFVLPFLDLRLPEVSRGTLRYRARRLPAARDGARACGVRGALFPWQSGSDGREESQSVHLNPRSGRWVPDHSRLQRHVGLAVGVNVWRHYQATGDTGFLCEAGAEPLLEVARAFADLAVHDKALDRYRIRGVMGPDEYHDGYPDREEPGLDDNAYTNVLASWLLSRALDVLDALPAARARDLREHLGLAPEEVERFETVSRRLYVPFHEGVVSQFAGYGELEELDWDGYRERYGDIRRLDRILEAEGDTCNRYKASKQADVLMLFFLLSPAEVTGVLHHLGYEADPGLIPRTIDYYMRRTSHGSTLSSVVHSWVSARRDRRASWRFFREALRSDIDDVQGGTTAEGIHLGAMVSTIDLLTRCFTGLEVRDGVLYLDPLLPPELAETAFELRYRGHWGVRVRVRGDRATVAVPESGRAPITVDVRGHRATVPPGGSWTSPPG
ncbi:MULTISPECIES: glycoside hydrolase family 65 protein [unclassified Nocardiopsis]|uniref:glycoside hydrolase family 65 protein n=1 Tax=Nocardiopsis TaxID=2013 RepID=UPI00387B4FE0